MMRIAKNVKLKINQIKEFNKAKIEGREPAEPSLREPALTTYTQNHNPPL